MIQTIQNEKINWFVNFIINNDDLLSLNPVIAGGSMLSLYRAIRLHDTDAKWEELKRFLEKAPKLAKIDPFGDIDIWFKDSNPIHSGEHQYNWLVADCGPMGANSQSELVPVTLGGPELGLERFSKASSWANSYQTVNRTRLSPVYSGEVQFIKKPIASVEELLSSFDFANCCVAWYDGKLYYDDRIDDAFSKFELKMNNKEPFERDSIAMRIFGALRAFKYSNRYNLDFDSKITEYLFKLYVDSKNIDYNKYGNKVVEIETLYGKSISSVSTLKGMVSHFHSLFKKFSKMKYFKKEYALYLVDCADSFGGLKDLIEEYSKEETTSDNGVVANLEVALPDVDTNTILF